MATLESIIADVTDILDRPDLVPVCRKAARNIVYDAHAVADFSKDLKQTAKVTAEENTTIALPTDFRKLQTVLAYEEDGLYPLGISYKKKTVQPYVDYYGFQDNLFMYYLSGGNITVQHNPSAIPSKVSLAYYAYPTVTTAGDSTVSTDSWMLSGCGEGYLRSKFAELIYARTGNIQMINVAKADVQAALGYLLAADMDGI